MPFKAMFHQENPMEVYINLGHLLVAIVRGIDALDH